MRSYGRTTRKSRGFWFGWGLGTALLVLGGCYTGVDEPVAAEPRSLEGVEIDGALVPTAAGEMVLDADARAFFDHFLAAEGEVDEAALHARVKLEIDQRLRGEAADQAWALFLAYLDYRREAAALLQEAESIDPVERPRVLAEALAEIRARTIGDAPGVPDEGPRLRAAASLQATLADPSLDARTRAERAGAFQAELGEVPDPAAPSRILTRVHTALAPIPVDDVEARRVVLIDLVGEAAAERWLALEHRRAEDLVARG
jgi:lipase chaperone LimK